MILLPSWILQFREHPSLCGMSRCYTDLMVWSYRQSARCSSCLCRPLTWARHPGVALCPSALCSLPPHGHTALWTPCRSDERPLGSLAPGRPAAEPEQEPTQTSQAGQYGFKITSRFRLITTQSTHHSITFPSNALQKCTHFLPHASISTLQQHCGDDYCYLEKLWTQCVFWSTIMRHQD